MDKIQFIDFNFKLAVIQELMYNCELLKPKFSVFEFAKKYTKRAIGLHGEPYEPIPEVVAYFEQLEIDPLLALQVTELYQDGGNEIYVNLFPAWDGEDDRFDIKSF